jgi:hypothetical protein
MKEEVWGELNCGFVCALIKLAADDVRMDCYRLVFWQPHGDNRRWSGFIGDWCGFEFNLFTLSKLCVTKANLLFSASTILRLTHVIPVQPAACCMHVVISSALTKAQSPRFIQMTTNKTNTTSCVIKEVSCWTQTTEATRRLAQLSWCPSRSLSV